MTNREREILELIKENPMISQKELSKKLNIERSSIGVHIANLIKKGFLKGKGYIVNEEEYVLVVGGSNIDISARAYGELKLHDSNPGRSSFSLGGVGRNISENLSKLLVNTKLFTVLGDDTYGREIIDAAKASGFDISESLILKDQGTSNYISVLDENGDMKIAISSMDIYEKLEPKDIAAKKSLFDNSRLLVVDTNIKEETLKYIVDNYSKDIFIDTVSTQKGLKVKDFIGKFHTIKPNKYEAEVLSGISINSKEDLRKCGEHFLNKGVKNVFITLASEGVYYKDEKSEGIIKKDNIKVVNATGAGDAFVAGLVYSYLNNYDIARSAKFSMAASILALSSNETINSDLSISNINRIQEEI